MSGRRAQLWMSIGLALLTVAAFRDILGHGFVRYDDNLYVTENAVVQRGLTLETVHWAFTTFHAANWHPLTWLSILLDVQLFGLDASDHHATSLVLHVANTLLLFHWLSRTTRSLIPSAFVAALFAWHPLHVEPVAWIAQRKDVLSAFFGLLALEAYAGQGERPSRGRMAWVALWLALGLLAKPVLVTLPCALLLLDYWPLRRTEPLVRLVREKLVLFALALASCISTVLAQQAGGALNGGLPLSYRCMNALLSLLLYLWRTVDPRNLAVFYPLNDSFGLPDLVVAAALLAAITVLALRARRTQPYLLVGWLWFLGGLVPMLGLVQVGAQSMADRYAYWPSIGLFTAVGFGLDHLWRRLRAPGWAAGGLAALLLGTLWLQTTRQVAFWENDVALWTHALSVTGSNSVAHTNLAVALLEGDDVEGARTHLESAAAAGGSTPYLHVNLGVVLSRLGRREDARREIEAALAQDPDYAMAHLNLGIVLAEQGRDEEAVQAYERALALDTSGLKLPRITAERGLESSLRRLGRTAEADVHGHEARRISGERE